MQEYDAAGLRIAHCDLYRVESVVELDELGLDDALAGGVVLIEWPERARERIPVDALNIRIEVTGESERLMHISGPERWADLLAPGGR